MALAGAEAMSVYPGDRISWYRSLAAEGTATPTELAQRTGTARYAREWRSSRPCVASAHDSRLSVCAHRSPTREEHGVEIRLAVVFGAAGRATKQKPRMSQRRAAPRLRGEAPVPARRRRAALSRPWCRERLEHLADGVPELHSRLAGRVPGSLTSAASAWRRRPRSARAYPEVSTEGADIAPRRSRWRAGTRHTNVGIAEREFGVQVATALAVR